jgi:hypothetical protein
LGYDHERLSPSRFSIAAMRMVDGFAAMGIGRNSTACTHVKMVVFAPIPRPSERTAATVSPGFFSNERIE